MCVGVAAGGPGQEEMTSDDPFTDRFRAMPPVDRPDKGTA
jgi:hypothetical protein